MNSFMQFQTSDFFTKEFSQSFLLKFLTPLFLHVHVRAHLKGGWREIPLRSTELRPGRRRENFEPSRPHLWGWGSSGCRVWTRTCATMPSSRERQRKQKTTEHAAATETNPSAWHSSEQKRCDSGLLLARLRWTVHCSLNETSGLNKAPLLFNRP